MATVSHIRSLNQMGEKETGSVECDRRIRQGSTRHHRHSAHQYVIGILSRLTTALIIVMPPIKVITPTSSQNSDPLVTHSQFATHNTEHRRRIAAPCRNHNRPRSATNDPTSANASCFRFIST